VGNFGSATRVDYTAIGEDVNMAARMEGLIKYLGTTVLMTGAVKAEIGDRFATRHLGRFQLKGFERAVEVHELLGTPGGNGSVSADRFAEGLKAFRARDLEGAAKTFERMLETHPHDGPAKFYAKHIEEIRGETATDGWSGEIELKEK
jgi:adenylate cyclase